MSTFAKTFFWLGFLAMILFSSSEILMGQNLVPNPGFERVETACLTAEYYKGTGVNAFSRIPCVPGWFVVAGIPDYFHFDHHPKEARYPEPKSGKAYAALYMPFPGTTAAESQLEFIGTALLQPLAKGQRYRAEVYVAKDLKHYPASIDGIGMLFSEVPFEQLVTEEKGMARLKQIRSLEPQVIRSEGQRLMNRNEWMLVSGEFIASGNEHFLTIGSFRFDERTLSDFAYYYFDEVSVIPISELAEDIESDKPFVLRNVFFQTGSAAIQDQSLAELQGLASLLKNNPGLRIRITGHTDDRGDQASNERLSAERAKAVADYLAEQGITPDRLSYQGIGSREPAASNDTEEGRALNRRIEVSVVYR